MELEGELNHEIYQFSIRSSNSLRDTTDQGIIDVEKAAKAYSLEVPSTIEGVIDGGEVGSFKTYGTSRAS